ncbi:hypothetical protein M3Y97_00031000 [Aphelenchoides bicaudatus]|nr:hypothetical protein M3Y97_00031000 [Aphelenchoides bicaudatus]
MTYNVDQENDVQLHTDYHNRFKSTKPFQVRSAQVEQWKKITQYVKLTNPFPATIFVFSQDTKCFTLKRKVDEIIEEYVNVELGFCDDVPIWKKDRLVLVLIVDMEQGAKTNQLIAGVALIDPVDTVIIQPDNKPSKRGNYAGINRLWIQQSMRRKSLGTLLTNVARSVLYPNFPKETTRAAFYQPTEESMPFVMAYFNNQHRYLVYEEDDD